ncbi:MAG: DUF512 domain-containing protein [Clostridia bacterium]|nr:DUF512 domain-containing protein [Clostridia bacterium]
MVTVTEVLHGSRAERAGILAGDVLVSINGNEITDVLDYRFYLAERIVRLALTRGDAEITVEIRKGEYDDVGLEFETPLMDKKQTCHNKCIFCFIDQLPAGLRESLYFKDDDSRLSFLHGNYVTLTNMKDADIDRIIKMHISPVNVSVHTTNPELRVRMMKNRRAGEVLPYLKRLADAGISICGQIVLCKGYNDGDELTRSMEDLYRLSPAVTSVSVVPFGMTRFREGLPEIGLFTPEECRAVVGAVTAFGDRCLRETGSRIFFPSDEFYLRGGLPLPTEEFYEGYPQIENGVGMLTSFETEFGFGLEDLKETLKDAPLPRRVSVATGVAAYGHIKKMCDALVRSVPGLTVTVHEIVNRFFGETITVAGLLTGKDISEQLRGKELGDVLLIPENTLRADGDLFLCGMTPGELSDLLGVPVRTAPNDGEGFVRTVLGAE